MKLLRRYIIYACFAAASFGLFSCDKHLDNESKTTLTDATQWASESNADIFLNDVYDQLPDMYSQPETLDNFTLKSLDKDEVRIAFTFWYQNIFGLPITLNDENVKRFIKVRGLDVAKFEEIADKLDINIAIVDDLIKSEAEDKRTIVKRKKV